MNLIGISNAMGVSVECVQELIDGTATIGVANKIGISEGALQAFIDGAPSTGVATVLGISETCAVDLREAVGWQGAVGLIMGLAIKANSGAGVGRW
jgi:hypothetical protein